MRSQTPRILVASFLACLLVIAATLPSLGYIRQPQARVFLSAPRVVKCDASATISAKVIDVRSGKPVRNQIVKFRLTGRQSGGDRLSAQQAKTNGAGVTSIRLSFGPKAGPRKVGASIRTSKPTITVRCAGGLPKTSVVPPPGFEQTPLAAIIEPAVAPPPPVSSTVVSSIASVRMPRLGIDLPVVEGDGYDVPEGAAAHYPGTAWPGEGSNTYLYGHAREGTLLELWQVRTGDLVEVDLADGSAAHYEVAEIHPLVAWDALEYLEPTEREILTLQTCLSYAETAPRFVVIAERVAAT
jgi:sortase A